MNPVLFDEWNSQYYLGVPVTIKDIVSLCWIVDLRVAVLNIIKFFSIDVILRVKSVYNTVNFE